MTLEQQLSKVRMFQTEVSMLRTRFLDCCRVIEPERDTFFRGAARYLQEAQDVLVAEANLIEVRLGHQRYCENLDEYGQPL